MIYKITLSNGPDVPIASEDDLIKFLNQANNPANRMVLTKYGIINPSYIVNIVADKDRNSAVADKIGSSIFKEILGGKPVIVGQHDKKSALEVVMGLAPFEKLTEKMSMTSVRRLP